MNVRNILVPVDFSTCSMLVTRQAAGLAAQLGARVVVLHVAALPEGVSAGAKLQGASGEQRADDFLVEDTTARLVPYAEAARAAGVEAVVDVAIGPVVPTILARADAQQADMIIIGTHGRTGLARAVLGSVAEAVSHQAHVPVLLVRRETRPECNRASCAWCPHDGHSPAEDRVAAEAQG